MLASCVQIIIIIIIRMPTKGRQPTKTVRPHYEICIVRPNRVQCVSVAEEVQQLLSLRVENCDFNVAGYSQALKSSYLSHTSAL